MLLLMIMTMMMMACTHCSSPEDKRQLFTLGAPPHVVSLEALVKATLTKLQVRVRVAVSISHVYPHKLRAMGASLHTGSEQ